MKTAVTPEQMEKGKAYEITHAVYGVVYISRFDSFNGRYVMGWDINNRFQAYRVAIITKIESM